MCIRSTSPPRGEGFSQNPRYDCVATDSLGVLVNPSHRGRYLGSSVAKNRPVARPGQHLRTGNKGMTFSTCLQDRGKVGRIAGHRQEDLGAPRAGVWPEGRGSAPRGKALEPVLGQARPRGRGSPGSARKFLTQAMPKRLDKRKGVWYIVGRQTGREGYSNGQTGHSH